MKVEEGRVYRTSKDDAEDCVEIFEITGGMFDQSRQGWYSYIKDHVGTIYKVYSDNTKQIVDTRAYDTFGNIINRVGTSTGNLGFQGKYYDQESGLYYFYNRYYNPANGRFINEDPIGLNGGLNMYGFVENNPVNSIDPFGLDELTDDIRVKIRMCCILERSGRLDQKWRGEKSFMVYEHKKKPGFYTFEYGEGKSERGGTTDTFHRPKGWKFKAYFHTHPPREPDHASGHDKKISDTIKVPVYSIGGKYIEKWYKNSSGKMGFTIGLIGWCYKNRDKWECLCKKK